MQNRKFTISKEDLNTENQLMIDCSTADDRGRIESTPTQVFFKNSTGKAVEINFISVEEINAYRTSTGYFGGIGIANGDSFNSKVFLHEDPDRIIDYLLVRKSESGDATADLAIYCMDYI